MNHLQQRFLMFLIGCIGIRSLFVIIAKYIDTMYLKYLGYAALLPAIGFIYIYIYNRFQKNWCGSIWRENMVE